MTPNNASIQPMPTAESLPAFMPGWAFFLDIDGTLAQLAHAPDAVVIESAVINALRQLSCATDGAVALITGRAIDDVDQLFAPLTLPAAGQHGIERRGADGHVVSHPEAARKLDAARHALARFADINEGIFFEDKGETLALHYRAAPAARERVRRLVDEQLERLGEDFSLQHGKMVLEIRPNGRDKGTAIEDFMREPPFNVRTPVFIGDDKTDEDGFKAVNRLGGHTVKVGPGKTAARWRLADVTAVINWLQRYADFLNHDGQQ